MNKAPACSLMWCTLHFHIPQHEKAALSSPASSHSRQQRRPNLDAMNKASACFRHHPCHQPCIHTPTHQQFQDLNAAAVSGESYAFTGQLSGAHERTLRLHVEGCIVNMGHLAPPDSTASDSSDLPIKSQQTKPGKEAIPFCDGQSFCLLLVSLLSSPSQSNTSEVSASSKHNSKQRFACRQIVSILGACGSLPLLSFS